MLRRRFDYYRIALIIALIMTAALTVGQAARAQGMAENPKVIFFDDPREFHDRALS